MKEKEKVRKRKKKTKRKNFKTIGWGEWENIDKSNSFYSKGKK